MSAVTSVMVVVATSVTTASTTVASATAAALTGDDVDKCLNLFLGGIVHREHLTLEYEVHACVGVVEVDGHCLLFYLYHETIHALAVGIDEGDDVTGVYLFVVKLAVHAEDILVNIEDEVVAAVAVSLVFGEGEVEGIALLQIFELLLERLEGEAEASGELEGVFLGNLFYKLLHAFILGIHVIRYDDRLTGIDFCQTERKTKITYDFLNCSLLPVFAEQLLK